MQRTMIFRLQLELFKITNVDTYRNKNNENFIPVSVCKVFDKLC